MMLHISDDQSLPADAVTATYAMIGKKGGGKTYLLGVLEEEFAKHGIPFTVIDSMSAHWGIKEKYQVVVFGGEHADAPLDPSLGAEMADLTIETGMSNILDIREWSEADRRRFVTAFMKRMMERNKTPRHLFMEEADLYLPETKSGEVAAVFHECDNVARRGRQFGLGLSMATQRPAVISKSSFNQADIYFFFKLKGTTDRKAVRDLLDGVAEKEDIERIHGRLPRLPPGTCIMYAEEEAPKEIHIRLRETYHAGRTPKLGEIESFRAVPLDASELKAKMAAMIAGKSQEESELSKLRHEKARLEEDNAKLEKRLEIRGELKDLLSNPTVKVTVGEKGAIGKVEPLVPNVDIQAIERKYGDMIGALSKEKEVLSLKVQELERKHRMLEPYIELSTVMEKIIADKVPTRELINPQGQPAPAYASTGTVDYQLWMTKLKGASLKTFQFFLQHKGKKFTRNQVALGAGYTASGGTFIDAMSELQKIGLLQRQDGEYWVP